MIAIRDVDQGSSAWFNLRLGIPTASRFESILTPATRKFSKAAESYAVELVTERLVGQLIDVDSTGWMTRGSDLEAEARKWYEFSQDVEVDQVAFCYTDDKSAGCSPDGLIGDDGLVEFKVPAAKTHVAHLVGKTDPVTVTQRQGQLWVTGRKWNDCVSYCPKLPPVLVRYHRDETWMAAFDVALSKFLVGVDVLEKRIRGLGVRGRIEGFGGSDSPDGLLEQLYGSLKLVEGGEE